jgi:hypothetical protein
MDKAWIERRTTAAIQRLGLRFSEFPDDSEILPPPKPKSRLRRLAELLRLGR